MIRCVVALALVACSHAAPGPTPLVRADVDRADDAERHRQHDAARAHYEHAIASAQDPASEAFARQQFAETLISWGQLPEAKTQLERAIAAKPDDPGSWLDLGMLRNHEGDRVGALAAFSRSKELAPNDPRPRLTLAVFLWKQGKRADAAAEYRALLELDLPDRLREKVRWALDELAKPAPTPPS
jgi:Flp pilus assembly protein TadD